MHSVILKSPWRTQYHIQTPVGLLNDPNGFCNWNGKWHIFYQYFPMGPVHGLKHWYLEESEDLLHWEQKGIKLYPDTIYDNKGCYSGCAYYEDDETLHLIYTGNHRTEEWIREPYQLMANMDKEGNITKEKMPLIVPQEGYTEHQRDPKLFKYGDHYDLLLGAQREDGTGTLLLFTSSDLKDNWQLKGELKITGWENRTYMMECPDLEKIGNKWLLLFSPQGLHHEGDKDHNKFQNTYFIGDFNEETLTFTPDGDMQELDHGFDFYAAQCAYQTKDPDAAYLTGWFGIADMVYPPTDEEGWSGLLTLTRKLTIENNQLRQRPAFDLNELIADEVFTVNNGAITHDSLYGLMPPACIIKLQNKNEQSFTLNLFAQGKEDGFKVDYNEDTRTFTIDRSGLQNQINPEFGTTRKIDNIQVKDLLIFIDHSSAEIFVNDGEYVLSTRLFPTPEENLLRLSGKDIDINIYTAKRTVTDEFVL